MLKWFIFLTKIPHFQGVCNWPKGRVLGGTSVLNFLIHTKGHKRDYDNWAYLGNRGWSYEEVLPYFMKTENVKIPELRASRYRGKSGYLNIEKARIVSKLHKRYDFWMFFFIKFKNFAFRSFIKAGLEMGYENRDPNNDLSEMMGFSLAQATMKNGRRCSAAKAYLRSIANRKNLHISLKSWVTKVVIDPFTKIATGVEFVKNKKKYFVKARKEVIVSAGSIGSPQLLMLSGVGPLENLEQFGIPVYSDLKVGYNLHDHQSLAGLTFIVNQPVTVLEDEVRRPRYVINYILNHQGVYTLPGNFGISSSNIDQK